MWALDADEFSFCRFQGWRDRSALHNATGHSRSGYTELKDEQDSLLADLKRSGKLLDKKKNNFYFSATDNVRVSVLTLQS